jgi:hypothetical protein
MNELEQIRALEAQSKTIQAQLQPLNTLITEKQKQLSAMKAQMANADAALDAAVKHVGTVVGMNAIGKATDLEVVAAKTARIEAETAHQAAQAAFAGARGLQSEIDGLTPVGGELGAQLMAMAQKDWVLRENYLRALADQAAAEYAHAAKESAFKLATMFGYQQALAAANFTPDLLNGSSWHFLAPSLNTPSASSPSGAALFTIENVQLMQPTAFAAIRARIAADGVDIRGL